MAQRYLVNLHVMINNKKITAIKDIRAATGMGLAQAKLFCETYVPNSLDSFGGMLICNPEQVARLSELDLNSRGVGAFNQVPTYAIMSLKRIDTNNAIDISGDMPSNY